MKHEENSFFLHKTKCELVVSSECISLTEIIEKLGIAPSRSFAKGDQLFVETLNTYIVRNRNLWALSSSFTTIKEETISHHIQYLKNILAIKIPVLKELKRQGCSMIFYVWIETDGKGIGIDLNSAELSFINEISTATHFTFLTLDSLN